MSSLQSFYKKWISIDGMAGDFNFQSVTTSICVFWSGSAASQEGIVLWPASELSDEFFVRIAKRFKNEDLKNCHLLAPVYLETKVKQMIRTHKMETLNLQFSPFSKVILRSGHIEVQSKIRVVNVDDSPVILKLLKHLLQKKNWIEVTEQINDSVIATEQILELAPDVVTLDIQMPNKNGIQVLKEILAQRDIPIIMVSSLNLEEGSLVFDALNAGAFDYIQKPTVENQSGFQEELCQRLLVAATGKVKKIDKKLPTSSAKSTQKFSFDSNMIWALGSSTGGPQAITRVLTSLPSKIPPTLIVQHMPPVYSESFAQSLDHLCPFKVKEAEDGDVISDSTVYIAKGGMQMTLIKESGRLIIRLKDDPPMNRFKPSVDYLFKDLAKITDIRFVAGILTGMGKDGAEGLKVLRNKGARTFAQDEESSAVFGMPRAAIEVGAAEVVCHIDEVATQLLNLSSKHQNVPKSA